MCVIKIAVLRGSQDHQGRGGRQKHEYDAEDIDAKCKHAFALRIRTLPPLST
jgi:hypothetical protein